MNIYVVVTFAFDGVHHWPECPFPEVEFLRYPHRHLFHVKMTKPVTHADRDVEIIMLKREAQDFCVMNFSNAGRRSCEDMALALLSEFNLTSAEVLEDGENGAIVTT
jgi:hypothetical protein